MCQKLLLTIETTHKKLNTVILLIGLQFKSNKIKAQKSIIVLSKKVRSCGYFPVILPVVVVQVKLIGGYYKIDAGKVFL